MRMFGICTLKTKYSIKETQVAGNTAHRGDMRNAYKIFVGKPEGKRPLGRPCISMRIILKWILNKQGMSMWTGFYRLRKGSSSRVCVNKVMGSFHIKSTQKRDISNLTHS
jgi:hypothetical protein